MDNYLALNINSDTFNGLKQDFNELLQDLLERMQRNEIEDAALNIKVSISLTESFVQDNKVIVPMFTHKVAASYKETQERAGAVNLPNMALVYDPNLCEYVMRPVKDIQGDLFADGDAEATAETADAGTVTLPMALVYNCKSCGNIDCPSYGSDDMCECDAWQPKELGGGHDD